MTSALGEEIRIVDFDRDGSAETGSFHFSELVQRESKIEILWKSQLLLFASWGHNVGVQMRGTWGSFISAAGTIKYSVKER